MESSETKMDLTPTGDGCRDIMINGEWVGMVADPIKNPEAKLDREVVDWWSESLSKRSGGRPLIVMSRLHSFDLPGVIEPVKATFDNLDLPTHYCPR